MLQEHSRYITRSGRITAPHPKIYQRVSQMLKAHRQWLKNESLQEAHYRMDDFNVTLSNALNVDNWSVADQECTLLYVFGHLDTPQEFTE